MVIFSKKPLQKKMSPEVVILSDKPRAKELDFENSHKVKKKVNECFLIVIIIFCLSVKPFERKTRCRVDQSAIHEIWRQESAALGLMIPMVLRTSGVPNALCCIIFRTGRSRKCR
jgi:hypothetical protein